MEAEVFIPIGRGYVTVVDWSTFEEIRDIKYFPSNRHDPYAVRYAKKPLRNSWLHKEVLKAPKWQRVDHVNGNRLDNRSKNLRLCTNAQNLVNTGPKVTNTSGFKGVSWHKGTQKWVANFRNKYIGLYATAIEAAKAYDETAVRLFGEFAWTNFEPEAAWNLAKGKS